MNSVHELSSSEFMNLVHELKMLHCKLPCLCRNASVMVSLSPWHCHDVFVASSLSPLHCHGDVSVILSLSWDVSVTPVIVALSSSRCLYHLITDNLSQSRCFCHNVTVTLSLSRRLYHYVIVILSLLQCL